MVGKVRRTLERVKERGEEHDKDAIKAAAQETAQDAKDHLKKKLVRLQKENQSALLDQLCWVAIQSDLLD